ncbi:hypothetical protein BGY98DRAFT_976848, partial [Russula aff. rugulosa BPL654]
MFLSIMTHKTSISPYSFDSVFAGLFFAPFSVLIISLFFNSISTSGYLSNTFLMSALSGGLLVHAP